jgi:flagellar biosynthesis protein FlhA
MGVSVDETEIHPERDLAINPGQVFGTIQGIPGHDPAFGLEAVWIEPSQREEAQTMGYTVVDASTVIATHISKILQSHAHELLGREEVQQLLDKLGETTPKLVDGLVPETISLGAILQVLQNLLREHVPIRDIRTIVETLAANATRTQDPAVLTTQVRVALGRSIVQNINGMAPEMEVITLDPTLERILQESIQMAEPGSAGIEPGLAERIHQSIIEAVQRQEVAGQPAVLLVAPMLRPVLAQFMRHSVPDLHVLAFNEIPDNKQIKIVASIGNDMNGIGAQ